MRILLLAAALTTVLQSPASAQSFERGGQFSNQDRRVSVGLTIPLGRGGSRAELQPTVDMAFDHRRRDANGLEIREPTNFKSQRPVRLGLTLSDKPQMMLNGRAIPELSDRKNISDGVLIGAGVVAVLGIGFYLMATGEFSGPTD